jgi:hypothetical protein
VQRWGRGAAGRAASLPIDIQRPCRSQAGKGDEFPKQAPGWTCAGRPRRVSMACLLRKRGTSAISFSSMRPTAAGAPSGRDRYSLMCDAAGMRAKERLGAKIGAGCSAAA